MSDKLRVGIIGCGNFSLGQNVPNCMRSELMEIAWLCDPLPDKASCALERCHPQVQATTYLEQVLEDPKVDMVVCAVPHSEHTRVITAAAAAGKHIFTEKPMAMTMEECYRIQKAVQAGGIKLCVDFNRGFSPAMQDFKAVYQAHRQDPQPAPGVFWASDRPLLPEESGSTLICRIQDESSSYGPVHLDWRTGGGEIIGETCHWLELICWLFEENPVRVSASGSARMTHIITLDFASGRQAIISFSVTGTFRYPKELYELSDHGAFLRSECLVENQYYGIAGVEGKQYPLAVDGLPNVGTEGGHSGHVAKLNARADHYAATGEWLSVGPDKGHFTLLETFARAILEDTPSPIDEKAGTRTTYLALRAIESLRLGHPVPVNQEDLGMFVW